MSFISVVITAFNNENTIAPCLESFLAQSTDQANYEIVVVLDGSTDSTKNIVESFAKDKEYINFKLTENHGVAAARNTGVELARGDVILFSQADIIADKHLIEKHLGLHEQNSEKTVAVVGFTTWDKTIETTPFMEWLEDGGPQFDYKRIDGKIDVDYLAFYTPNLSIKKDFIAENNGFDETLRGPAGVTAYEDSELGYRLANKGMVLKYEKEAIAYHRHAKTLESVLNRRYYEGIISHQLAKKHPDMNWGRKLSDTQIAILSVWLLNPVVMYPLKVIASFLEKKTRLDIGFKLLTRSYYNWGVIVGMRKNNDR